jgi:RND family efflux transporter MFP subunit
MQCPRTKRCRIIARATLFVAGLAGLAGCQRTTAPPAKPGDPTVIVATPITREVADFEDFVGQTMAVMTIDVRARVTGYLDKVFFEDGTEVEKDVQLFQIDPRPYEADVARTKAALAQADAHNRRLEADYKRAQALLARDQLARADYDLTAGDYAESTAMVDSARAQYEYAQLNLAFTKVLAPITGRLSRRLVDPGNLVSQDSTILTSIVSLDPIYVYFDLDERTLLKIRRLVNAGKIKSRTEAEIPVFAALADEEAYPHRGTIDFSDNRLDTSTGTLRVRAKLPNPKPREFSPGMFMKVHLPVGVPHSAMLVPEEAVGTDQGEKFVFVVDAENVVRQRRLKAGGLYFQKWRAVDSGLGPDDRIIISGLQRVRPGLKVVAKPGQPEGPPAAAPGAAWPTSTNAASAPPPPPKPAVASAGPETPGEIAAKKSAER